MSTHKYIDKVCAAGLVLCLLLTIVFFNGETFGIQPAASTIGYEDRLFSTEQVHTIAIVMDDWDGFLETCENEEYAACSVVIDGEAYKNIGLRAKGNTSLTTVSSMNSDRYSFKLEFDHYDTGKTYYGLDKLCLNNVIQDTTYMKDYLTYQMMITFGVNAPLCSYVYVTVNGEDWGLYLAVEGIEDAFLRRNYGSDAGELYKPDSMSFGGGRGNGKAFMRQFINPDDEDENAGENRSDRQPPEDFALPEGGSFPTPPDGVDFNNSMDVSDEGGSPSRGGPGAGGGPGDGMGSNDVKLRYIDDDPNSYSNIFQNAKTDISEADQNRLIYALKNLSAGEDLENTLDVDEVLRYFVVHNFVCNGDSYTGTMVHNYYLYEEDGQLSMIPWDYNLAYGTFQGQNAASTVNSAIDSPVSGSDSRPMLDWIFSSEAYTALYHQYFREFLESIDIEGIIDTTAEMIAPYVENDPTAFYTYEEFQTGVEALRIFCRLRSQSISRQLDGTIASTTAEQDSSTFVDASALNLSDMGTMNRGGGNDGLQKNEQMRGEPPMSFDSNKISIESPANDAEYSNQPSDNVANSEQTVKATQPEAPPFQNGAVPSDHQPGSSDSLLESEKRADMQSTFGQDSSKRPQRGSKADNGNNAFPELPGGESVTISASAWFLFSVSLAALVIGVLTAFLYRRTK